MMLIAHSCNVRVFEGVDRVSYAFQHDADEASVRERVIKGWTLEKAIGASAAYRAFKAFGFKLEGRALDMIPEKDRLYKGEARFRMDLKRTRK